MDYLVPTAMETPAWETERTVTPSPHHPLGAKGVGEIGDGRRAAGDRQRRRRCVVPPRRDAHRDPDHAASTVALAARERRRPLTSPSRARSSGPPPCGTRASRSSSPRSSAASSPPRPGRRPRSAHQRRRVARLGRRRLRPDVDREGSPPARSPTAHRGWSASAPDVEPEDGIVSYPMTCHSGGTLEIYLEPVLPAAAPGRARRLARQRRPLRPRATPRVPRRAFARDLDRSGHLGGRRGHEQRRRPPCRPRSARPRRPVRRHGQQPQARRRPARRTGRRRHRRRRPESTGRPGHRRRHPRRDRPEHPGRDRPPSPHRPACASYRRSAARGRHRPDLRHGSRHRDAQSGPPNKTARPTTSAPQAAARPSWRNRPSSAHAPPALVKLLWQAAARAEGPAPSTPALVQGLRSD